MRPIISAGEVIALVSYIRKRLKESSHQEWATWASRRTAIQKIAYFALSPEERRELYEPYLYGPYSNAVQGAIIGLERGDFSEETAKQCPESWQKAVDRVLEALGELRIFRLQDLVLLSKVHFLYELYEGIPDSQAEPEGPTSKIKSKAQSLGWKEILSLQREDLEQKIRETRQIQGIN